MRYAQGRETWFFGLKVPGSERDTILALFKGKFANESNHGTYGFVPDSHIRGEALSQILEMV